MRQFTIGTPVTLVLPDANFNGKRAIILDSDSTGHGSATVELLCDRKIISYQPWLMEAKGEEGKYKTLVESLNQARRSARDEGWLGFVKRERTLDALHWQRTKLAPLQGEYEALQAQITTMDENRDIPSEDPYLRLLELERQLQPLWNDPRMQLLPNRPENVHPMNFNSMFKLGKSVVVANRQLLIREYIDGIADHMAERIGTFPSDRNPIIMNVGSGVDVRFTVCIMDAIKEKTNRQFTWIDADPLIDVANYLSTRSEVEQVYMSERRITIPPYSRQAATREDKIVSAVNQKFIDHYSPASGRIPSFTREAMPAELALPHFQPDIVFCSWMPYKIDLSELFRKTPSIREYILVGSMAVCGTQQSWAEQRGFERTDFTSRLGRGFTELNNLFLEFKRPNYRSVAVSYKRSQ